jgi:hypothetical protein
MNTSNQKSDAVNPLDVRESRAADAIIGLAVVPFACNPVRPTGGQQANQSLPAGWVLPGGERTTNQTRVLLVARRMDELLRGPRP